MKLIKSITGALNGRKRLLGLAALFIYGGLVTTGAVEYNDVIAGAIAAWCGIAYGHAAYKG